MSNKSEGTKFENEFCDFLAEAGFFVIHYEGALYSGAQPADIMVIKNNYATLLDCKVLKSKTGRFPISRIEANQILAYRRYRKCQNDFFLLAVLWNNDVYLIDLRKIKFKEKSFKVNIDQRIVKDWKNWYEKYEENKKNANKGK